MRVRVNLQTLQIISITILLALLQPAQLNAMAASSTNQQLEALKEQRNMKKQEIVKAKQELAELKLQLGQLEEKYKKLMAEKAVLEQETSMLQLKYRKTLTNVIGMQREKVESRSEQEEWQRINDGLLRRMNGEQKLQQKVTDQYCQQRTESELNAWLEKHPDDADAFLQRAKLYSEKRWFHAALQEVERSLAINPQRKEGIILRGWLCKQPEIGRYQESLTALNQAIAIDPLSAACYGWRAEVKEMLQTNDRQVPDDYMKALCIDPGNPYYYQALASWYEKRLQFSAAIVAWRSSLTMDPKQTWIRLNIAEDCYALHDYEQGIRELSLKIVDTPDGDSYRLRATGYMQLRRSEEAVADLQVATVLKPDDAQSWFMLAQIEEKRGNARAAAEAYRQYLRQIDMRHAHYDGIKTAYDAIRQQGNNSELE